MYIKRRLDKRYDLLYTESGKTEETFNVEGIPSLISRPLSSCLVQEATNSIIVYYTAATLV